MTTPHEVPTGALRDMQAYYARGFEKDRLARGKGLLEALRTRELLDRWLPAAPAMLLDVGGAAGRYALPLAEDGYEVHLIDPVPLHVQQALEGSQAARRPLASVLQGDARMLPFGDASADAVLLLGPLYHLTTSEERSRALREAGRVLRPGGVLVAAAISRYASAIDGMVAGLMRDQVFAAMVVSDLTSGVHYNPTDRPEWFTTTYFHHPDELRAEVAAVGLDVEGPLAVEGMACVAPDLETLLQDQATRTRVLSVVRATESEPTLLGFSEHLLIAGRKP